MQSEDGERCNGVWARAEERSRATVEATESVRVRCLWCDGVYNSQNRSIKSKQAEGADVVNQANGSQPKRRAERNIKG